MAETIFGIDKGIIKAFALMILVVGSLTTFFLSEYVSSILLGSVFYTATNGTIYRDTAITGESFTVYNSTYQETELANNNIKTGTIVVYNASDNFVIGLGNFTVDYTEGNISLKSAGGDPKYNNTILATNYTYTTESSSEMPITSDASNFIDTAEDDFVTTFGYVNTGIKFAAALITVVAVILVFASFLPKNAGKGGKVDY